MNLFSSQKRENKNESNCSTSPPFFWKNAGHYDPDGYQGRYLKVWQVVLLRQEMINDFIQGAISSLRSFNEGGSNPKQFILRRLAEGGTTNNRPRRNSSQGRISRGRQPTTDNRQQTTDPLEIAPKVSFHGAGNR